MHDAGENFCPRIERLGETFLHLEESNTHTRLSNVGSQHEQSTPERKETDKLEFEHRSPVTPFNNWKTSFWREVITGPTHHRQVTD